MSTKKSFGRISKAGGRFIKTFKRCLGLINLYLEVRKSIAKDNFNSPAGIILSDLIRSSVVLAIAGFDDYFTSRFSENIIPFIKKKGVTPGIETILRDSGFGYAEAIEMSAMSRPMVRLKTTIQNHLENLVTQKFEIIDSLFLCLGIKDFSKNVQSHTKRKNLIRRIELLTQRRHDIVHKGDLDKRGRIRNIDPKKMLIYLDDLYLFVNHADILLNKALGMSR